MRDYTGKQVFVGIDVHKTKYAVAIRCEGMLVQTFTCDANGNALIACLQKNYSKAKIFSAYEAGYFGYGFHRQLLDFGINNIVVNAASIEVSARDRVKTDKRDAKKIAEQLECRRLTCIQIPTVKEEQLRSLTRHRRDLVKKRCRVGVQLKSLLVYHGLSKEVKDRPVCLSYIKESLMIKTSSLLFFKIEQHADLWHLLTQQIKDCEKMIDKGLQEICPLEYEIALSVPGIGKTAAGVLLSELGDISNFSNKKKIASFTGLTPCEYSSGDTVKQGRISRQGRPQLRCILNQAAWVAIKKDKSLHEKFNDYSIRMGKKKAITAISRQLLLRLRACLRDKVRYELKPMPKDIDQILDKATGELVSKEKDVA